MQCSPATLCEGQRDSRVADCKQVEGEDGETETDWLDKVVTFVESVGHFEILVVQVSVGVLLLEDELGRAEEVQSQHAAAYLFTIDFERHIKRDVSGSVRQNHFNGIVLS